jgi:hypothetical protein
MVQNLSISLYYKNLQTIIVCLINKSENNHNGVTNKWLVDEISPSVDEI